MHSASIVVGLERSSYSNGMILGVVGFVLELEGVALCGVCLGMLLTFGPCTLGSWAFSMSLS